MDQLIIGHLIAACIMFALILMEQIIKVRQVTIGDLFISALLAIVPVINVIVLISAIISVYDHFQDKVIFKLKDYK